jgi:hypothetical protein
MKFLKRFRLKSKSVDHQKNSRQESNNGYRGHHQGYASSSSPYYNRAPARDYTKRLPPDVLTNIFAHVCPHALDDSLNSSEESMTEDGCMLCDMRDLAHCSLVSRRWYSVSHQLL